MKLTQTIIFTDKIDQSVSFYRDFCSLEIIREFEINDSKFVFLGDGNIQVELISDQKTHPFGDGLRLGFNVDDLDKTLKDARERKYHIEKDITIINEFVRYAVIKDPSGVLVHLIEMSAANER